MKSWQNKFIDKLWSDRAHFAFLFVAAAILLLGMLGGREIWTQEWRWADISWQMLYSKDFLHPYLAGAPYYDKPLLSYWLIIGFSYLLNGLNEWALRLPSALAGLLAIWCVYRLGYRLVSKPTGFVAAWMLATTYYFLFWARTANADTLNYAGILLSLVWYVERREQPGFTSYSVFYLIIAITCLFKGLIAAVIPIFAILPDLLHQKQWRKHLRWSVLLAAIPALIIYLLPFLASSHFNHNDYAESGLYLVYRENVLRYFHPFDHMDPFYTYFIYLPIYLLPWSLFLFGALWQLPKRWRNLVWQSRWIAWMLFIIFTFLTLSGSRRNYYVLPLVPFATLFTAEWLTTVIKQKVLYQKILFYWLIVSYLLMFVGFLIIQPLYYQGGMREFSKDLRAKANAIQPWSNWQIILLDARSKLTFYLHPSKPIQILGVPEDSDSARERYNGADLVKLWPILLKAPANTILVTRQMYLEKLKPYLQNYQIIPACPNLGDVWLGEVDPDLPIGLLPKKQPT